jgi:hypothetical protein
MKYSDTYGSMGYEEIQNGLEDAANLIDVFIADNSEYEHMQYMIDCINDAKNILKNLQKL